MTGSLIHGCLDRAATHASEEDFLAEFAQGTRTHDQVRNIITELDPAEGVDAELEEQPESPGSPEDGAGVDSAGKDAASGHPDVDLFLVFTHRVVRHFRAFDSNESIFTKAATPVTTRPQKSRKSMKRPTSLSKKNPSRNKSLTSPSCFSTSLLERLDG